MRSPESVGCQWFEQVWNRGDVDAIFRLVAPDMRAHGADGQDQSPEDFASFQRLMRAAMPDLRIDAEHCIDTGRTVAVHWHARGTHTGTTEAFGPGTGRVIDLNGLSVMHVEDGRIVEAWDDYDHQVLMARLGAGV